MQELFSYQNNITNLQYIINILNWELKVIAPKNSKNKLIEVITEYESKLFRLKTADEYGKILYNVINSKQYHTLTDAEKKYIQNLFIEFNEKRKIPIKFYEEYVKLKEKTNNVWKEAKLKSNFKIFEPYIEKMIKMTKRYYSYIRDDNTNLYDIMIQHYSKDMNTKKLDIMFNKIKSQIIPLIAEVKSKNYIKYSINCSDQELIECAKIILDYIGFDFERGSLGIYPHFFTTRINSDDIRIAISNINDPFEFVTYVLHEGGHGLFEQGINKTLTKYENKIIENIVDLHESQSKFFENIIGRNSNFWLPIYDKICNKLHLNISLDEFVNNLNIINPNISRVKSDELTYCMHIIIRYEIERDLFNGIIKVDDLPKIWKEKVKDYLGLNEDSFSDGLLQDIHWSIGYFGYFPSYLLGTIYDGIFLDNIEKEIGDIDDLLNKGKIKSITNYLKNNIYKYGGAYSASEVINKLYDSEVNVDCILTYFLKKYQKNKFYK